MHLLKERRFLRRGTQKLRHREKKKCFHLICSDSQSLVGGFVPAAAASTLQAAAWFQGIHEKYDSEQQKGQQRAERQSACRTESESETEVVSMTESVRRAAAQFNRIIP